MHGDDMCLLADIRLCPCSNALELGLGPKGSSRGLRNWISHTIDSRFPPDLRGHRGAREGAGGWRWCVRVRVLPCGAWEVRGDHHMGRLCHPPQVSTCTPAFLFGSSQMEEGAGCLGL